MRLLCVLIAHIAYANLIDPHIIGTWSSKSGFVTTGPGAFSAKDGMPLEPDRTGASYSFSAELLYEKLDFFVHASGTIPACNIATLQWQQGQFEQSQNGSLKLTPQPGTGRQMVSNPCQKQSTLLKRWDQPEFISRYEQTLDSYQDRPRLNLFSWDGSPRNPMWLLDKVPRLSEP